MAAKVRKVNDAWYVVTHHRGKRNMRRIGPTKADKRKAEKIAEQIDASIALNQFGTAKPEQEDAIPCDAELRRWFERYSPTLKPGTRENYSALIDGHLIPHFADTDLRTLSEEDLLGFIKAMQAKGRAPGTIKNALSVLRRACNVAVKARRLPSNPASGIGRLITSVQSVSDEEVHTIQTWTPSEVKRLLTIASKREPRLAPLLQTLFLTGMRRGEALGLKWSDLNFDAAELTVCRQVTTHGLGTPKGRKARRVKIPPTLAETLFDLLAERRRECLSRGWREVPEWIFPSESGGMWSAYDADLAWGRVHRRAQREGVRKLKLHATRHTYATQALAAGKSLAWVSRQLGHSSSVVTLENYGHVLPEEERDLSFTDFGVVGRRYTATENAPETPGDSREGSNPRPIYGNSDSSPAENEASAILIA